MSDATPQRQVSERPRMLRSFDATSVEHMRACRAQNSFFWLDLTLDPADPAAEAEAGRQLAAVLGIPPRPLQALLGQGGPQGSVRERIIADDDQVVLPFVCARINPDDETKPLGIHCVEVKILVHGDFLVTVHRAPLPLQPDEDLLPPLGEDETYLVYVALEQMVDTLFQALDRVLEVVRELERDTDAGGGMRAVRQGLPTLRGVLTMLRRDVAPQARLFAYAARDIQRIPTLQGPDSYVEDIGSQLSRMLDSIDATSESLTGLSDHSMNGTMYRLTAVATITLPLAVLTGFFGMNFAYLVEGIDTRADFFWLGVIPLIVAVALASALLWEQTAGRRRAR